MASFLASQLKRSQGKSLGFVIMPDHVHAIVWFGVAGQLSEFIKQWKRRTSMEVRKCIETDRQRYAGIVGNDPIWQARYYAFNILSETVLNEKLEYMHNNPIKAGLAATAEDWPWSSARWYLLGKPVGVPLGW